MEVKIRAPFDDIERIWDGVKPTDFKGMVLAYAYGLQAMYNANGEDVKNVATLINRKLKNLGLADDGAIKVASASFLFCLDFLDNDMSQKHKRMLNMVKGLMREAK